MQRPVLILLLLVIPLLAASSDPTAEDRVLALFPGLEQQLAANLPAGVSRERARSLLTAWYGRGNSELIRGMKMVLAGEGETNHALSLLLHLLASGCSLPEETMPLALALANNRLYAQVSAPIREAILKDMVRHYALYRRIVAWQQKTLRISLDLSRMPLIPQLYWADRAAYPPDSIVYPVRTIDDYREFIDSIETLEFYHALAGTHELAAGDSFDRIAQNIVRFLYAKNDRGTSRQLYDPDTAAIRRILGRLPHDPGPGTNPATREVRYRGQTYHINRFTWGNYQRRCLQAIGQTVGSCMGSCLVEQGLFKGLGIPAGLMIRVHSPAVVGHAFAMYYNPFRRRWNNLGGIRSLPSAHVVPLYLHKPVWHHRLPDLPSRVVERAVATRFFPLLWLGLQETHFNRTFAQRAEHSTNLIFGPDALPDGRGDRDGDTILDFEERLLGLDPDRPDTARDGVSDLWKLEHGHDPRRPLPGDYRGLPPVDGLGGGLTDRSRLVELRQGRPAVPAGDGPRNLASLAAGRFGDRVYVTATFHSDLHADKNRSHFFTVVLKDSRGQSGGFDLLMETNHPYPANGTTWARYPDGLAGIIGWANRTVELAIPVHYLNGAAAIGIRYFSCRNRPAELVLPLRDSPAGNAPLVAIVSGTGNLALSSEMAPAGSRRLALTHRYPSPDQRWRILPAHDPGWVLLVVDDDWTCLQADLTMGRISGATAQHWKLEEIGKGLVRIIARQTGRALRFSGGIPKTGTPVNIGPPDGGAAQRWRIIGYDKALEAVPRLPAVRFATQSGGLDMDLCGNHEDGSGIVVWTRETWVAGQQWVLLPAAEPGVFHIVSRLTWNCLDAVPRNGTWLVVQKTFRPRHSRKWRLQPDADGWQRIICQETGLALDAGASVGMTRLQLKKAGTSPSQLWKIEY